MSIHIKSEAEIEKMRKAGKVLAKTLSFVKSIAKEGLTTKYLDLEAEKFILSHNMIPGFKGYKGFPATMCSAVNNEVVHTIPNDKKLENGDILTVDCGVILGGFNTDAAITFAIGNITEETEKLLKVTEEALMLGIKQVKPGNKVGDIGSAIQKHVEKNGFSIVRDLTGHGIGKHLHEDPAIPNHGKAHSGIALKPGMTIAIEPIVSMGKPYIETLKDGWNIVTKDGSLACQFEHTILITNNGYEILTSMN